MPREGPATIPTRGSGPGTVRTVSSPHTSCLCFPTAITLKVKRGLSLPFADSGRGGPEETSSQSIAGLRETKAPRTGRLVPEQDVRSGPRGFGKPSGCSEVRLGQFL